MKLFLVRHLWGVDLSDGFEPYLERWREVGYQAIEGYRNFDAGAARKFILDPQGALR